MSSFLKFPMNKLCYDLILELILELDLKDVPTLMKVNKRFRSILFQTPTRIFGKRIYSINIEPVENSRPLYTMSSRLRRDENDKTHIIQIKKFFESMPLYFNLDSIWLLLTKVERSSMLNISQRDSNGFNIEKDLGMKELLILKKIFFNLNQVNELYVQFENGDNFVSLFEDFKTQVIETATLDIYYTKEDVKQQMLIALINENLKNCKMISLNFFKFSDPLIYSALSKTQLKVFVIDLTGFASDVVKSAIGFLLNSGIPSDNKEAACFVLWDIRCQLDDWIRSFPNIRRAKKQKRTLIQYSMTEILKKHKVMRLEITIDLDTLEDKSHRFNLTLDDPMHYYWQKIDHHHDCIYAVNHDDVLTEYPLFFTKYVKSIE